MAGILNTIKFDRTDSLTFQEEMIQLGMWGLSLKECGDYYSMDPDDWIEWCNEHPIAEVRHACGKARGIALAGKKLIKQINDGKTMAIMFYLKTQGGFTEKLSLQESVKITHVPPPTIPSDPVEASKVYQRWMKES